jgi:hypothetical protein
VSKVSIRNEEAGIDVVVVVVVGLVGPELLPPQPKRRLVKSETMKIL